MTRPTGPADRRPTDDATQPSEPTGTSDTTEPTDPTEPTEPTEPVADEPDDATPPPGKQQDPLRGGFTKPV